MRVHFLGICGTFMGSLALLAREMGHEVSGCDENVYPPMSTQLEEQGITIYRGYDIEQFQDFKHGRPDLVIIGNALSRGNLAVEYVLDKQLRYCSGPQWLSEHCLQEKWVLAVAGTHGKTTTTSMLAWILEYAGYQPGFLIGGVPGHFECSARLGDSDFFVIEADEYDTAFFDKRSKFIHYHPRTLVLNNLEYDHADIFPDIAAIQRQFHHLLRIVPSQGRVIYPKNQRYLNEVLEQGVWSETASVAVSDPAIEPCIDKSEHAKELEPVHQTADWLVENSNADGSQFDIVNRQTNASARITWQLIGEHNMQNALTACAAAAHVGVSISDSSKALSQFKNVKRRLELLAKVKNSHGCHVHVYDDFAHHPTAISMTLQAIRNKAPHDKVIAVLEPRSNTMKQGIHGDRLISACCAADQALWFVGENTDLAIQLNSGNCEIFESTQVLLDTLLDLSTHTQKNSHIVIMSNGSFSGLHERLISRL